MTYDKLKEKKMSGGSYDYLCFKIDEAGEQITMQKDHQATRQIISKLLMWLGSIMREVEWQDSGDGGNWEKVDRELKKIFNVHEVTLEKIKKLAIYDAITEIFTQLPL